MHVDHVMMQHVDTMSGMIRGSALRQLGMCCQSAKRSESDRWRRQSKKNAAHRSSGPCTQSLVHMLCITLCKPPTVSMTSGPFLGWWEAEAVTPWFSSQNHLRSILNAAGKLKRRTLFLARLLEGTFRGRGSPSNT